MQVSSTAAAKQPPNTAPPCGKGSGPGAARLIHFVEAFILFPFCDFSLRQTAAPPAADQKRNSGFARKKQKPVEMFKLQPTGRIQRDRAQQVEKVRQQIGQAELAVFGALNSGR